MRKQNRELKKVAEGELQQLENIRNLHFDFIDCVESIISLRNEQFVIHKNLTSRETVCVNTIEQIETKDFIDTNVKALRKKALKTLEDITEVLHEIID